MKAPYDPGADYIGGYTPNDGTLELYRRIRGTLSEGMTVVDVGAGRGSWYYEDDCHARREARDIGRAAGKFIGIDIDPVVLKNETTTENHLIVDGRFPLEDDCADVIISDFVFEHIEDVPGFACELTRILKAGGYIFGRTPHRSHYVSLGARLVKNVHHSRVLRSLQPARKAEDVFPTVYRLNSLGDIGRSFPGLENHSYLFPSDPSYFFGTRGGYNAFRLMHRLMPAVLSSTIMIALRKKA